MKEEFANENDTKNENYNYLQGRAMTNVPTGEELVITGLSGTFPNSTDVYHYQYNLFNKINMVLPNRRWNYKHPEIPVCSGTIPEVDKYDAGFFGVHHKQGQAQDVMGRVLLEKTVEAILDAGLTLEDFEGTNTGVYVGTCFSESEKSILVDRLGPEPKEGFSGCTRSTLAHRISYFLKLKGPSFITDTACSSSLFATEAAFRDLRMGVVDAAIVCGSNMCFHPFVSLQFARLGVLSLDGSCKVFDQMGNGYARSEAVGTMIIQKKNVAKRNYGQLIYIKTNCDGFKEAGITYPSGETQKQLLTEFYQETEVNPADLSFLEAHGTGTFVGDPEECASIDDVLAKCRKDPLLIGSVKSNIGHSEPASGICSITKCIIGLETGYIPPNLHFTTPRDNITGIMEGRLEVVTEKMPFKDNRGLVGINSFGFGGSNCHLLIKANEKEKVNNGIPKDDIPRVVCISGRTKESITTILDDLKSNNLDAEHVRLLHDAFRKNIPNHIYRGYSLLSKSDELYRFYEQYPGTKTPLYFAFGELNEWYDLGKRLLLIPNFSKTMEKAQKFLLPKGVDVHKTIFNDNVDKSINQVLGSILVQIGIIDLFKELEIQPTNYFGYSYGELLAAYFDGIITFKQIIECALALNFVVDKINNLYDSKGRKNVNNTLPNGNADRGNNSILDNFRSNFKSTELLSLRKQLLANLSNILEKPQIGKSGRDLDKFGSADYFVNALLQKFSDKFDYVEQDSIVLTFGVIPSLNENREEVKVISLVATKDTDYLEGFLKTIGNLYVNGFNPQLAKLYPEINFPVSKGTRMISPFIRWKHTRSWYAPLYNLEAINSAQHGTRTLKVQLSDQQWSFIQGHVIDGRTLFPATGYLYLAWETLALIEDVPVTVKHIIFEDIKFLRATTLAKKGHVKFEITINRFSGNFEIVEGGSLVVTGRISSRDQDYETFKGYDNIPSSPRSLSSKDVYKELRLRGYNYSGDFRSIKEFNPDLDMGLILWKDNWISFMDNMLQLKILNSDTRLLYVPTHITQMVIPAKCHLEWINRNYLLKQKEPLLPVHFNKNTGDIRCGNIVIKGLIANSIHRRKDLGIPVLEKHQFIPNITALTLDESIRVNMQILLENALIKKVKCVELIDEFTKDNSTIIPSIKSAFEDQPLIQPLVKILTKITLEDIPETIQVEDKELYTESECNLIVGTRLLERASILKTAYGSLKENGFIISREQPQLDSSAATIKDFTIFTVHYTPNETIVLLKKNSRVKELIAFDISSEKLDWIKPLQELIKTNKSDNVVLYAQNKPLNGILGFVNCIRREPETSYIRALFVMDDAEEFDRNSSFYKEQLDKNMAVNVWKNNTWGTYRHLRLGTSENVKSQHCFVNTTIRGDLSSLRWIENNLKSDMVPPPEKKMVHIHYASLNFRDVMTASGKINIDVITTDRLEQECVQGFEFSGYTTEGRRVMGMVAQGAMSTLMLADEYLLFDIPDSVTLKEAATIPVVYGTVIYGLLIRTQLKKGESILIHSGTGGIGQAAIRIALHYGCTVFTTVGTTEKREFLLKTFPQLKAEHIGSSRDLSFIQMIRKYTKNRGVDVVLNSLAEEKLQASIRCLARGGRFVEIGKFDLGNNNELKLSILRKEASFHGIMLDQLFTCSPDIKNKIVNILTSNIGIFVKPLPITCFGYNQVEEAFRYMSSGKHIGKVAIQIREEDKVPQAVPEEFVGIPRYFCYPEKTYVIVGGLGGFGLELADWLVLKGAKNLVLTSRKGVTTGYQKMRIRTWESYGTIVHISTDNIYTEEGCRNLLQTANKLGNVHSIFNLAVVLSDAIFENQTLETFQTSLGPKAVAASHLDRLSRVLCPTLKDFVIFSSVSCGRGNAGQTNYGMSNSIMERICEQRKKDGYPALAIQWGAIGDVGLIAELQEEHVQLEIGGTLQQKISSCLNVLNNFLGLKDATVVSSIVVAEKRGGLESCDNVIDTVLNILGLTDAKLVSHHATLPELGMDSMTGVEIKQTLEREFEIFLTPKDMKTMTLAKLKEIQEERCLAEEDVGEATDWGFIFKNTSEEEEVRTSEVIIKSNISEEADMPTVLMFPGIEGFAKIFTNLASNLNAHVVAYQYWERNDFTVVDDLVQALLPKVENQLKNKKRFTIIGYSFGSLVATEIVSILESKGYSGNLIIIDGSAVLMKKLVQNIQSSESIFETSLICHLLSFYLPRELISNQKERIFKCNEWNERLDIAEEIIKQVIISPETIAFQRALTNGLYNRIKSCESYIPSFDKLKSRIILFKPTKQTANDIDDDYGLSQITESQVQTIVFEGNHLSIVENDLLANEINSLLKTWNEE
ncbi:fatty acid synthase-like [Diorhabda carinulata]|uniref:fatty acid synthase-like n=1 Tax=Diorhabda carinulata TaxID=1163345 RepID=UPI0025A1E191|nr:fatty acid synthase-like [Diorhabda carinulata]XP_057672285.1 fatty acid synthase-like [Diorhabda carinulata]